MRIFLLACITLVSGLSFHAILVDITFSRKITLTSAKKKLPFGSFSELSFMFRLFLECNLVVAKTDTESTCRFH